MIKIYQIDSTKDTKHVKFMSFDWIKEFDFSIYKEVWSGELEYSSLDDIFRFFNLEHPSDFKGHSLSISDIVQIVDTYNNRPDGYYFCDSFGWKQINIK